MMQVIDESKVIETETLEGRITYILQDGVYLNEVFDYLPCGIINKSETGMGATTIELDSDRNSIIVEPTKITASSKAYKAYKHKALYVGSATKYHPKDTKQKDIKAYIEDESIPFKKIVVVADSLSKVIEAIGDSVYQDYHLFLDEIDSFQMDSTFRDSMEICLDYYKLFNSDKRLMVSATLVEFSDPELKDEPYTIFQYEKPSPRTISLIHCGNSSSIGNFLGCVFEQIKLKVEEFPEDKLMVAFNSVTNSHALVNNLINQGVLSNDEVGILCGVSNKKELGDFYTELSDELLPKRINFVTSAYFTGYDIKEPYHLISVSSAQNRIHSLSDKKLKQIAGRCRKKLHSETIVYNTQSFTYESVISKETLIDAAEKEILGIKCLESNYESNLLLSSQLGRIRNLIMENTHDQEFRLVRRNIEKQNIISYLNIDANLENQRVRRDLYQSRKSLNNLLKRQGHSLTFNEYAPTTVLNTADISEEVRMAGIKEFVEKLRQFNHQRDNLASLKNNLNQRERTVYDIYEEFHLYIDNNQLLNKIEELAVGRDDRALKNLRQSAGIAILPTNHAYFKRVMECLGIDHQYTYKELVSAWNEIFQNLGLHKKYADNEGVKALKWTKLHFKAYKVKKTQSYRITGINPNDFTIIQFNSGTINDVINIKYLF